LTLAEIAERLKLRDLTPEIPAEPVDVKEGHASDLLSDVLANAPAGGLLVTIHAHMNVIAVSVNAGLAAVVFSGGRLPEEPVRRKAVGEGIRLYASDDSTFNIVGQLYGLGLRGPRP